MLSFLCSPLKWCPHYSSYRLGVNKAWCKHTIAINQGQSVTAPTMNGHCVIFAWQYIGSEVKIFPKSYYNDHAWTISIRTAVDIIIKWLNNVSGVMFFFFPLSPIFLHKLFQSVDSSVPVLFQWIDVTFSHAKHFQTQRTFYISVLTFISKWEWVQNQNK